jgi:hypothetical protein
MPFKAGSAFKASFADYSKANTIVFGDGADMLSILQYNSMKERVDAIGVTWSNGQWRCTGCNGFTFNGPYGLHRCPEVGFTYDEFPSFFTTDGSRARCKFCNNLASITTVHKCKNALPFGYVLDASHVSGFDNQEKETEYNEFFMGMSAFPNRIVSVFQNPIPGSSALMRHDLFVGPTTLSLANQMGLFTLSGVKKGGDTNASFEETVPNVSHEFIGCYTGKEIGLDEPESLHISSCTVTWDEDGIEYSRRVDAKDYGGPIYFANQAHQGFKPVLQSTTVSLGGQYETYLCVCEDDVAVYGELFWDYDAVTDDQDDPLIDQVCVCGCGGKFIKYVPKV